MKKVVIISLACLPFLVNAQNTSSTKAKADTSNSKVMLYMGFAYQNQSFNGLNTRLASLGAVYSGLPQSLFGFNFGWVAERKNVLTKFSIGFASGVKGDEAKRNSQVFSLGTSFDVGYNLSKNKLVRFYPMVGFGATTFLATLKKDISNVSFNDILQNPTVQASTNPVKLSNTIAMYRLGFGVDFFNKQNNNLAFGVYVGYNGSFKTNTWKVNEEQQISNSPADGLSQFIIGINLSMQRNRR
jgi:hypothetical protein